MNFKKFNGTTWETVQHKIYGSGTDSLTAFPAVIQAAGGPLTDYLISGNTVQNGTPTPEAPVEVQGCGERTGNLFDKSATNTNNGYISNGYLMSNGNVNVNGDYRASEYIAVSSNQLYALFYGSNMNAPSVCFYDSSKNFISGIAYSGRWTLIFTTPQNAVFLRLSFRRTDADKVMLNLGSTAIPYEPYGYKLTPTVTGTEHPIYLGQAETTRRIKKLVLTGGETFGYANSCFIYTFDNKPISVQPTKTVIISNAYKGIEPKYRDQLRNYECCITRNYNQIAIRDDNYTDVADFKSYLAAQYANGNPVTVWYVLAEPETAVVNEPIHKIGDYADTISFAQAEVTIPTFDGDNTITFGTSVQPSGMSATFKGWHPVQGAKTYDGNDWS